MASPFVPWEVEYDRSCLNPFYFSEKIFDFLVYSKSERVLYFYYWDRNALVLQSILLWLMQVCKQQISWCTTLYNLIQWDQWSEAVVGESHETGFNKGCTSHKAWLNQATCLQKYSRHAILSWHHTDATGALLPGMRPGNEANACWKYIGF